MSTAQDTTTARKATRKPGQAAPARRVRRGKPGDLEGLRRELWHAIRKAGDLLDQATDAAEALRAVHAIAGAANAYRASTEVADLAARLAAIEAADAARGGRP